MQWLSGRVLDSKQRGPGLEPHGHYCVVPLSKTHLSLLSTGSIQEDLSRHNRKIVDWDVKNPIKQTKSTERRLTLPLLTNIKAFISGSCVSVNSLPTS